MSITSFTTLKAGVLEVEVGLDPFDLDQEVLPQYFHLVKGNEGIKLTRCFLDTPEDEDST